MPNGGRRNGLAAGGGGGARRNVTPRTRTMVRTHFDQKMRRSTPGPIEECPSSMLCARGVTAQCGWPLVARTASPRARGWPVRGWPPSATGRRRRSLRGSPGGVGRRHRQVAEAQAAENPAARQRRQPPEGPPSGLDDEPERRLHRVPRTCRWRPAGPASPPKFGRNSSGHQQRARRPWPPRRTTHPRRHGPRGVPRTEHQLRTQRRGTRPQRPRRSCGGAPP